MIADPRMRAAKPIPSRLYGQKRGDILTEAVVKISGMDGRVVFTSSPDLSSMVITRRDGKKMTILGINAADCATRALNSPDLWRFLAPKHDKPARKAAIGV